MNWMTLPYRRYADFSGRSTRREFWMFWLFLLLVYAIFGGLLALSANSSFWFPVFYISAGLFELFSFIPTWAVAVRRLHDTDRSGWNLLWNLVPVIGQIVLIVFWAQPGMPGQNRYGINPFNNATVVVSG